MIGRMEIKGLTPYHFWSGVVTSTLGCQWELLRTQYEIGLKLLEGVLGPAGAKGSGPEQGAEAAAAAETAAEAKEKVQELERRAANRVRHGLAPPKEIYDATCRSRIDWSRFPEWARPSDPELFEGCAHEG
jgi:hypothetical protein